MRRILFFAFLFSIYSFGPLAAGESASYQHTVDTNVVSGLTHGANAIQFMRKKMPMVIRTAQPLTSANISSATIPGMLYGKYLSPKGTVDLELKVGINQKEFEVNYTPSQIDAIVFEWEEIYSTPAPLKGLNPRMKKLVFHEGEGLRYNWELKSNFSYLLTFNIAYDDQQKKLEDRMSDLAAVRKFISSIESDLRGRTILQNNKSGQPALIAFEENDGGKFLRLHHPMHDIVFNRSTKSYGYTYTDEVAAVSKLPEVKRTLADPNVRKFVLESTEPVQVRVQGEKKTGFGLVFTRVGSGQQLRVRFDGKKVVPEPS